MADAIISTADGRIKVEPYGSDALLPLLGQALRSATDAQDSADEASVSAAVATAASGPNYASTSAGLAATTNGQSFAVDNGDGTVTVYRNNAGSAVAQRQMPTVTFITQRIREKLTGNRSYYVNGATGSNSNTGLSSGAAFATLQKAIDTVMGVDLNGCDVTINVANGTYAPFEIAGPWTGRGTVYWVGNTSTPASCVIASTSGPAISLINNAALNLRGCKVITSGSGSHGVRAYNGSILTLENMDFGSCVEMHMECGQGGVISISAGYTISGGAMGHWHCGSFGLIQAATFTVAITGTPAFGSYFAGCAQGHIIVPGVTFTGLATGMRYLAHFGGVIRAAGIEPALPGNVAGRADTGGVYIASQVTPMRIAPDNAINNKLEIGSYDTDDNSFQPAIEVISDGETRSRCFFDGDDGYVSGRFFVSCEAPVSASSGTAVGWKFGSKSEVAAGLPIVEARQANNPVGYLCRSGSDGAVLAFNKGTTGVGSISVTATATAYNTSSDYRLKKKPTNLTGSGAFIDALKPKYWTWKADDSRGVGFIAHEVQAVSPSSVTGEKDGREMQAVAYASPEIIANIVAELQSLRERMAALETA